MAAEFAASKQCVATPNTATTKKRRSVASAHHILRCDEKRGLEERSLPQNPVPVASAL